MSEAVVPLYADRRQLEETGQIILGRQPGSNFMVAKHRRDRPNLGRTVPTPLMAGYMAIVQLRNAGQIDMLCDARHEARARLPTGALCVMDLRRLWVADIKNPFDNFSFLLPQSRLDEFTDDLGQPPIETMRCSAAQEKEDEVMLRLAQAMSPAFSLSGEANSLVLHHLFQAAMVHLAETYGGLKADAADLRSGLTIWQERRAKEYLAASSSEDPTIEDMTAQCDLPPYRLTRAFTRSVGMPPHRWLTKYRLSSAKHLLASTDEDLQLIAKFCGFGNAANLERKFSKLMGVPISRWRNDRRS